jgi:hypothetical protein
MEHVMKRMRVRVRTACMIDLRGKDLTKWAGEKKPRIVRTSKK